MEAVNWSSSPHFHIYCTPHLRSLSILVSLSIMSSFNAFGFFALAEGRHIATTVPGATYAKYHVHYTTSLKTLENSYVAATLRVYSGAGDAPLPDNTIAFVVAKVCVANGQPVELDALSFAPIPGDVNADDYQVGSAVLLGHITHLSNRITSPTLQCISTASAIFPTTIHPKFSMMALSFLLCVCLITSRTTSNTRPSSLRCIPQSCQSITDV